MQQPDAIAAGISSEGDDSVGYRGPLSLELKPTGADPIAALREGKELLEALGRTYG